MAKINFPDSPTLNEEFVLNDNRTYVWNGSSWELTIQGASPSATAPSITVVSTSPTGVTFTLTNNDDNTAIISYDISTVQGAVELGASATSSNITVDLSLGTYTLTAFATVVGEVATQSTAAVEIVAIPAYELLYEETVTTAKTQIDITGLNIGKDDGLRLVYTIVGDSTTTADYDVFPNNLTTQTNYNRQVFIGAGATLSAVRQNLNYHFDARSNQKVQGFADIKVSNNDRYVAQSHYIRSMGADSSGILQYNIHIVGTQTVTSITSLKIVSNRTNGIAVGSKIALYKVTEVA